MDFNVNASNIDVPGENLIGQDLGVGEVNGNVGAVVEGYGAALSRITQELIRLMRSQQIMAVWLFDESNSMKDDQKEISQKFHKVYEELGIQERQDKVLKLQDEVLLTAILSFGKDIHELTKTPTSKVKDIQSAIEKIPVDESGEEMMCSSIGYVVDKFGKMARSQKRRLVIIIVSDESPSDSARPMVATTATGLIPALRSSAGRGCDRGLRKVKDSRLCSGTRGNFWISTGSHPLG